MYDLAVAYRIYPGVSKSPAFFSNDKFQLSNMCLQSFKGALGCLRVKIWVLLDGCPPAYEDLFRKVLEGYDLEVLSLNKEGNLATFSRQIDILAKQTDAPFVYFSEDDYFYLPNALETMVKFMQENRDVDFVTPYDHPDSYDTSSRFERHLVRPFGSRYWRTASSTCLTFLTSRDNLIRTQSMFRTYSRGNWDCPVWLSLTQKSELANLRVHWNSVFRMAIWAQTWRWGLGSVLFRRRHKLWVPLPTLATHMESTRLSPLIDWQAVFENSRHLSENEQSVLLSKILPVQ
ncbi:glycosyltransferase [Granulicella sp. S156]|uniref:glycosyltransferase n=1 Tax=Granulicella sp. S156 TaxID=1747224 RepID=UPI00131D8317|nr:glycosyltransferase [Granulicella sp. S156]